jgi:ABC-type multidrug transport system fused ATPase/permease subunit
MFYDKLILDFLKDNWLVFIIYIIIIIVLFPIEGLVLPNIYGNLFESIKKGNFKDNPFNIINNIKSMNSAGLMALIVISWILVVFTDYLKGEVEAYLLPKYLLDIRDKFFRGTINKHDEGNFTEVKSGEYLARIMELSRNLRDAFMYLISRFLPEVTIVIMILIYLCFYEFEIGKIMLFSFILCSIISIFYGMTLIDLIVKREEHFLKINENLINNFNNLMNIYTNNNSESTVQGNADLERHSKELMNHIMNIENLALLSTQTLTILAYGVSIYYLYQKLNKKEIKTSTAIAFILVLGQYLTYVMEINWGFIHQIIFKSGIVLGSKKEMEEIFAALDDDKEEIEFHNNNIVFKNIKFKYEGDKTNNLFDKFNLKVKENEKIGIIGRSGSGKTTLAKMLVKLHIPNEGEIYIGGQEISNISKNSLRKYVNYVNQKTNLFDDTLIYNLKYGNEKSDEEIKNIIKKYGLDSVYSDLKDGYKTEVGINGGNLSLGMQKVTTLVRSTLKESGIIIFDEPLAGLDEKTRTKVIKMIINECKTRTMIIITHDQEILPYMDRVININELQKK